MAAMNDDSTNVTESSDPNETGRSSQGFGGPEPSAKVGQALKDKGQDPLQGARAVAERGKDELADEARGVARALHQASEGLREGDHEVVAADQARSGGRKT